MKQYENTIRSIKNTCYLYFHRKDQKIGTKLEKKKRKQCLKSRFAQRRHSYQIHDLLARKRKHKSLSSRVRSCFILDMAHTPIASATAAAAAFCLQTTVFPSSSRRGGRWRASRSWR